MFTGRAGKKYCTAGLFSARPASTGCVQRTVHTIRRTGDHDWHGTRSRVHVVCIGLSNSRGVTQSQIRIQVTVDGKQPVTTAWECDLTALEWSSLTAVARSAHYFHLAWSLCDLLLRRYCTVLFSTLYLLVTLAFGLENCRWPNCDWRG